MEYSTQNDILQPILENGIEGFSEVLQKMLNLAMKLECEKVLKASPYQRTEGRTGYANGFKERHIQTRMGDLELQIPQPGILIFIRVVWKKGCAVNERSVRRWQKCIFRELLHDR